MLRQRFTPGTRARTVALDETDHALIQAVLEDADRSLRELADEVGVTAPTVASRLARLEDLGVLGPARREADLAQLGTLVLLQAQEAEAEELVEHDRVHQAWRTETGQVVALGLFDGLPELRRFETEHPEVTTTVLDQHLAARTPRIPEGQARIPCAECGKIIQDEGIGLKLGGRSYVVCCPSCKKLLEQRYERHELGA